jgi:hypothetical protein
MVRSQSTLQRQLRRKIKKKNTRYGHFLQEIQVGVSKLRKVKRSNDAGKNCCQITKDNSMTSMKSYYVIGKDRINEGDILNLFSKLQQSVP